MNKYTVLPMVAPLQGPQEFATFAHFCLFNPDDSDDDDIGVQK
jgi:hypothetical protein